MNHSECLVRSLVARGFSLAVDGPNLKVNGPYPLNEIEAAELRDSKGEIIRLLSTSDLGAVFRTTLTVAEWAAMRALGDYLGKPVFVDGRRVWLWGITPRGAIVDVGGALLTVDFACVEKAHRDGANP